MFSGGYARARNLVRLGSVVSACTVPNFVRILMNHYQTITRVLYSGVLCLAGG